MADVLRTVRLYQIPMLFLCIFSLAWGTPTGEWEQPLFPAYSASYRGGLRSFAVAHVTGAWGMIGMTLWMVQAYTNLEIDPWWYGHASRSTIVLYIFHWFFCKWLGWRVIKDYELTSGVWTLLS